MSQQGPTDDRHGVLQRLQRGEPVEWPQFLEACSPTIDRVVRRFGVSHDDRMDLFLHVCERLRERGMRRIRAFDPAAGARCDFKTYLAVVVRNLAIDRERMRRGRFRMFRRIDALDVVDRRIADYRFRQGRTEDETRHALEQHEGPALTDSEFATRLGRVERTLSWNQRWRLFARWSRHRPTLAVDPTDCLGERDGGVEAIATTRGDPRRAIHERDARREFANALATLTTAQRLVLAYRFVDGRDVAATAKAMGISSSGVERLTRGAVSEIRRVMGRGRVSRDDFEQGLGYRVQEAGRS